MAEREAPGDFDYLFDDPADPADIDEVTGDAHAPEGLDDDQWDEPDGNFWDRDAQLTDDGQFDAFNTNTWYFRPAPTPWYRTKQAMTALIAAAAAMALAIVGCRLCCWRSALPTTPMTHITTTVTPTAPISQTSPRAGPTSYQRYSSEPRAPPPPPPPTAGVRVLDLAGL